MTADRQTVAWAKRYQELLRDFTETLGGENISPARRATVRTIATLQTELSVLGDRFAANGRGASPDDLSLFLKISATVGGLLESVGLGQPLRQYSVDENPPAECAHTKLHAILTNLIRARKAEEAQGIFRDGDGNIISDLQRLAIEQAIFDLKQQRDAIDSSTAPADIEVVPPSLPVAPCEAPPVDPAAQNVIRIHRTSAPSTPPVAEKSTTQRFLEWNATGGGSEQIINWNLGPDWPRIG
jgi:hypothetical protein